jgi:hypothetical protein
MLRSAHGTLIRISRQAVAGIYVGDLRPCRAEWDVVREAGIDADVSPDRASVRTLVIRAREEIEIAVQVRGGARAAPLLRHERA